MVLKRPGFLDRGQDASKLSRLLDTIAFLPHAIPSILLGVGLAYLGLAYRDYFPVYGTIIIIAIAHTISWIAYGTRTTNGVMIQVHRELEEAGKVAGASTPRVLGRIVLPLIAAGIFNSWIWISMLSYREVTMALGARHAQEFGDLDYCLAVLGQRLGAASFGARRDPRVVRGFGRRIVEVHLFTHRRSRSWDIRENGVLE